MRTGVGVVNIYRCYFDHADDSIYVAAPNGLAARRKASRLRCWPCDEVISLYVITSSNPQSTIRELVKAKEGKSQ